MSYFISPSSQALERALESWHWLDLNGKQVILVTAFADVFLSSRDGIWFLDTLEGNIKRLFETREGLDEVLATEHGQDTYLMSPLIDFLVKSNIRLEPTQCYDFKLHPRVGGQIAHENVEARDFVVALNLRGQLHEQVRHLKPGTKISSFKLTDKQPLKPWWKLW